MMNLTRTPSLIEIGEAVREGRKGPQVELGLVHRFAPNMYIRELTVPAGTYVITKIHHTEHPFVISRGKIKVWTADGGITILQAPHCGITKPGTIRLALTLEDTVWTTFHVTNETDVPTLERTLATDPVDLLDLPEMKELTQ